MSRRDDPILEVLSVLKHVPDGERQIECSVDRPKVNDLVDRYSLDLEGWVIGKNSPVVRIEAVQPCRRFQKCFSVPRPDVAAAYPGVPDALHSGFRCTINAVVNPVEFDIRLQAILGNGSVAPIATSRVRRRSLRPAVESKLQPLLITSLGRSGSSWVMQLLGKHPGILVHGSFPFELHHAHYWMSVLRELSDPSSYALSAGATDNAPGWWLGDGIKAVQLDPALGRLLGGNQVEHLAEFCRDRLDQLYCGVASLQQKTRVTYFAEKYGPGFAPDLLWDLFPGTREIILVRDFRDLVCSVLAFNAKRGTVGFDRERVSSDIDYVQLMAREGVSGIALAAKRRKDRAFLLRYEDLVERPKEMLGKVLRYLDLDAAPRVAEQLLLQTDASEARTDGHRTSRDVISSVGRWKHDLPAPLRDACNSAFGPMLLELGYEL